MPKYRRLTYQDRLKIEAFYNHAGLNAVKIAEELHFQNCSIYLELKHGFYNHLNGDYTETKRYSADLAQRYADFQRLGKGAQLKIGNDHAYVKLMEHLILKEKLSPAAALSEIKRRNIEVKTKISLRTLYKYIEQGLFPHITNQDLPYRGTRKRKYHKVKEIKQPSKGTSIDLRPPHILNRDEFGHWEMDSVIGQKTKGQTLLVFTERKTRFEIIYRAKNKTATETATALNRLERKLGKHFRPIFKSITCDNGCEFAAPEQLELSARGNSPRTKIYYCHPYCSSERGSNENQNRIIRRFIAKGTPISGYTDTYIKQTEDYLNDLPRKLLNWQTARECFESELQKLGIPNLL